MKAIYIHDSLHGKLKLVAAHRGESLKSLVEALLDRGIHEAARPAQVATEEIEALAARGGSFDFLEDRAEDLYSLEDGEPIE